MSDPLERFRDEYAAAFRAYLTGGGETGLESAYELGRKAVTGDLGLLDLAGIHHGVLAEVLRESTSPRETERRAAAGTDFFLESLSTFEMTQRGFREAQATAQLQQQHATQLRGMADAALAVNSTLAVSQMLDLVTERARTIIGAHQAMISLEPAEDAGGETETSISISEEMQGHPQRRDPQGAAAALAAPLIDRTGRRVGAIQLSDKYAGEFTENDEAILVQLAQVTSVAIENARLYERERGIAVTLQRNLLPRRLPDLPGVTSAARYLAGGDGVEVGGDWYDVIPLSDGRVGIAIGDVVGRGVRAATIMGQIRVALRAYALEEDAPAKVAARVARFVETLKENQMTTCAYVVIDPRAETLMVANAGHLPPLLLAPDGTASFVETDSAPPFGVGFDEGYEEAAAPFEAGATLLLYTDGLVEERGVPLDVGLDRLRSAAAVAPPDPQALCDSLLGTLVQDTPGDDVALVAVRTAAAAAAPLHLKLPADPSMLAPLRRTMRDWLERAGAGPDEAYDIALATGEAAANAVEHANAPPERLVELSVELEAGAVAVTVTDFGSWRPPREQERGRGLGVMRKLMDEVNVSATSEGTSVELRRRLRGLADD